MNKKSYEVPELTVFGTVEELTAGDGWGAWDDALVIRTKWGNIVIPLPGDDGS